MKKALAALLIALPGFIWGQDGYVQEGEFGIGVGAAHYFGDLNTRARVNRPKPAASLFFRKNLNNYIAVRLAGSFAQLGYSDVYNTHNDFMRTRNLSFNTKVWELGLQGDFNFFRYMPGDPYFAFTPYVTFGVSLFNYDPYAYLNDEKYFLRPLGTEGQNDPSYPERSPYGTVAMGVPFGVGFKYAINARTNIGFEVVHRFTNTDYLDDVSMTYAGAAAFPPNPNGDPSPAFQLQDRSGSFGTPIGVKGRQRGNSENKDQFTTALFFISFNLQSYRCPSAN